MLKNYILIAFRNLNKFRFFTFINIAGLTVGLTACLVILLFVRFELSYDKFNAHADRIFRVDWELFLGETHAHRAAVTPPMAEVLVRDYPEIEAATRFRFMGSFQFKRDVENIVESRVVYSDNDMFKIFTIPFLSGNPENALKEPNTMVITESCAKQFFPEGNALGKTLTQDNKTLYKITGIIKDLPENSHFQYRMFLSMEGLAESKNGNWIGSPYNTYLLLRQDADPRALESKLPHMLTKYLMPQAATMLGSSFMDDFKKSGNSLILHLRPLLTIHLHSNLSNELGANGDIAYVYLFSAVAIFILVLACINFMNLATARSLKRAREVGIRKVMGSSRMSLAIQFLGESTMMSMTAFILSVGLTESVLPGFNLLSGLNLSIPFGDVNVGLAATATAFLVGIVAGLYPGFVLSAFKPIDVLKGKFATGKDSSVLRSGLVVFQFSISIFLMIATMALYQQMNYMQNKKLGFNKDQVIVLKDVRNVGNRLSAIRDEMVRTDLIKDGTISSFLPGPGSARKTPLIWKFGSAPLPDNSINAEKWTVDYDYVSTLGIEMVEGRNFSRDFPSDSSGVILNETAVKRLGLSGSALGQKISLLGENAEGSQDQNNLEKWTIVGVAKDFHYESLRETVAPLGLFFGTTSHDALAFRFESNNTQQVIEAMESKWKTIAPGEPFHYSFLDENFSRLYNTEKKVSKLFVLFAGLAMIIACLGLFALTAYTTEQRTKEIGIRKVMGASGQSIVLLLSRGFGKLILLGFVIAVPLAAYGIHWYLQDYAYKASISLSMYVIAGLMTFLLAFLTMGFQSIKAARTNPVDALKSE